MELQLKNISETDMQQVSGLYYSAFPEDERAPCITTFKEKISPYDYVMY